MRALARELRRSMQELREIGAGRIASEDIPSATDELDAIIETTAAATGTILDACEQVEAAVDLTGDALAATLTEATTAIYQACNFQDLTGQRVGKVVSTLRNIDRRVKAMCLAFGLDDDPPPQPEPDEMAKEDDESRLLNGPALPDQAMSQDDIDRILAGLD
ncbi:MAG: protein phosphatase CheZ [Alphaproteobacteria bacterium]